MSRVLYYFTKLIEWLNLLIRISKFFEIHPKDVANHQTTHTLLSVHGIGRGGGGIVRLTVAI